jgi:hypothetical protein
MHLILSINNGQGERRMPTNFDPASIARTAGTTARTIGSGISAGLGLAANLGAALNNISDPQKLLSSLRSIGLPPGGNILGSFGGASASFSDGQDWRVRLSLPPGTFFDKSPVLKPLIDAGGLIFPYTPSITMSGAASYGDQSPVHQNFGFFAYENSKVDQISIQGTFYSEDGVQAAYWLAVVHFLRSATKMFSGQSENAGNPPVILKLNGYGDYVFKNIPVVVKSFQIGLPADVNYITTKVGAPGSQTSSRPSLSIPGLQNNIVGGAFGAPPLPSSSSLTNQGPPMGTTHVPTKSEITITLQPVYSRETVRQFSLQKFVNGEYVNNPVGFV